MTVSRSRRAARATDTVRVPATVVRIAGGDAITPVWRNQLGGLTFRVDASGPDDRHVKWVAAGTPEIDLHGEASRLRWIAERTPVPNLIEWGADDEGSWLVTASIPATSAVDTRWDAKRATAVAAIGRGLRLLHERLPVEDCPFTWDVASRLGRARERLMAGDGPEQWFPEHRGLNVEEAWARLNDPPSIDRLVVCHGDSCAPNTLVYDDGRFAAHVDLGSLGIADRWADLAVAAWSTEWNYGPGLDALVYESYGIRPDQERIAYYRLLWDLA
jgi:kanamycin kinase